MMMDLAYKSPAQIPDNAMRASTYSMLAKKARGLIAAKLHLDLSRLGTFSLGIILRRVQTPNHCRMPRDFYSTVQDKGLYI